jgi:3-methyladenine DNA glycosylase/8-oxoguanine DNA glycosylase
VDTRAGQVGTTRQDPGWGNSRWVNTGRGRPGRVGRLRARPAPAQPVPWAEPDATGEWRPPFPVDLLRTLTVHRRGPGDPAFRIAADGSMWRTALTPEGPGTLRVTQRITDPVVQPVTEPVAQRVSGPVAQLVTEPVARRLTDPAAQRVTGPVTQRATIQAAAWGPGASWLLSMVPAALGADDDPSGFDPVHPVLRRLAHRHPGLRIGRTGLVMEALVPAVLEQKVSGVEAHRAWRLLMLKHGTPAPGPAPRGMRVFPPPAVWRRIPSWEWHRAGVEAVRARTIIGATHVAGRLEEIVGMTPAAADRRLQSLPGIGPWTSAEIRQRACGDPDAVSVGDLHLPGVVGWALAGRVVDDAGMLELLAPYAGHRHRAASLVVAGGFGPPRRGPRMPIRDYRSF